MAPTIYPNDRDDAKVLARRLLDAAGAERHDQVQTITDGPAGIAFDVPDDVYDAVHTGSATPAMPGADSDPGPDGLGTEAETGSGVEGPAEPVGERDDDADGPVLAPDAIEERDEAATAAPTARQRRRTR